MVEEETKGAVWQKLLPIEHGVRINVASIHPSASSADKDVGFHLFPFFFWILNFYHFFPNF